MDEKIKEEQISFLQKIKSIFSSSLVSTSNNEAQETVNVTQEAANFTQKTPIVEIDELIQRIERIEKALELQQEEGVRKSKVKEQIISLLQQNKKLTSSQLSKLIGLSRTRCSEYFRELMREGKTEGVIINRQKYYKLVGK